jgi:hypothetical protein
MDRFNHLIECGIDVASQGGGMPPFWTSRAAGFCNNLRDKIRLTLTHHAV